MVTFCVAITPPHAYLPQVMIYLEVVVAEVYWMRCPVSDRAIVAPYSGSVLIISSIDTKYWFFPRNGLDNGNICL
ncbi:hypothetical protein DPMN_174418 [Dreissena polymorpha]|uniref:Uncharacterized protein n=1 Tax=Dreissena polymorpha TaxID=45954 RepID=A0A9D4E3D1_DREPO|nr:hypothetical protein DPMN_174418 [Dreissena polymorpha]